jgi:hypothetical protein
VPTTREVEAARVERVRRMAEQAANRTARSTPAERRQAAAKAAHDAAHASAGWYCRRPECVAVDVFHPEESDAAALAASAAHQARRHPPADPPPDLEEQRAAWIAAGRPRLDRDRPGT